MRVPRCTYRVQLNADFTFDDLARRVPYLAALGVSDCYCSPIFRAAPGSRHGYDVCDFTLVNPELGGEDGLRRLAARLRAHDMGLLLDFVPNHMGIAGPFNRWWLDVLERGRASPHATFFDIRWHERAGRDGDDARVLAPLLPDHYGRLLERGELKLVYENGGLALAHADMRFPVRPETYVEILREIASDAAEPSAAKARLGEKIERSAEARAALDACLERLNGTPGDPASFDRLDRIIEGQHYRLARWQAGARGANYRRFFAIDTLVGLRMEDPKVFAASHARLGELIRDGVVTGLRIDHVDGLRDPEAYLERLQELAAGKGREATPFYVVVEKILAEGETLPPSWKTQGTTGYDFIPALAGLLADARNEAAFDRIYAGFTGRSENFGGLVWEKKQLVLRELFANTVLGLAQSLDSRIRIDRRWRDLTVPELVEALCGLIAGFEVYRAYRRRGPAGAVDRGRIERAAEAALARNPRLEPAVVLFLRDILLGDYPEAEATPAHREAMNDWALTVQQYTGAVMAKAVEDTAFYTFNRLIGLNEVGGSPTAFGPAAFHRASRARFEAFPHSLLATSTHDTKASEDVRARLHGLSEIPGEWQGWLEEWRALNAPHKTRIGDRFAPDADEEYRLYQTLLGAWPLPPAEPDGIFRDRIAAYLRKAVSEAKVHTTAIHPNEAWLEACDRFVHALLAPGGAFCGSIGPAAARLARLGMVNSLAQTVLKLTAPGVPDIYQGNESWDFSLVDPDNRRAVDFDALEAQAERTARRTPAEWLAHWVNGDIKRGVIQALLRFRARHPELFEAGGCRPLEPTGSRAENLVAFLREHADHRLLVLVPRLAASLPWPPVGEAWRGMRIEDLAPGAEWENPITGASIPGEGGISLETAFADLPVAVLHATGRGSAA